MSALDWIAEKLQEFERQGLSRRRVAHAGRQQARLVVDGRELINFASNDYLGLAGDPRLASAAQRAIDEYGWGAGASPLVSGYSTAQAQLETDLAGFEGTEAALVFSSGFAANLSTIGALVGAGDVVFGDHLNHASLIDGCRLSGARMRTYRHGDMEHLERLLKNEGGRGRRLIVSDSLFSMDGDLAPLAALAELAERYQAMLLIDEAHGTGVFGEHGRGVAEFLEVADREAVRVGTLSKALGCVGGFVAGSQPLVDWLVHRARGFVYSTALPAANCVAASTALAIVRQEPERRRLLLRQAEYLRGRLRSDGWKIGGSASQVIPILIGDPRQATALSAKLGQRGYWAPAIRPPAVPAGTARLRISLTAAHTQDMLDGLLECLAACRADS